jgi:hypothetical protein
MSTTVQPLVGEWQTVSLTLPGLSFDPEGMEKSADILIMIAPLDMPAQYTLRSVTIEPVTHGLLERLWVWGTEQFG